MTDDNRKKNYSVVVPIFNEVGNIYTLYMRLIGVLENTKESFEIIFVNDASSDLSFKVLCDLASKDKRVKVISFSRNFGHQSAFIAGLDYAEGSAVVLIDGDLQDPPEVIKDFINAWQSGWEVVYGIRKKRKENFFKKTSYFLFYRLLHYISEVEIPLDAGDFSLLDKKVVQVIRSLPERKNFIRGLRSWVGFKQKGIEYERAERHKGRAKYTFNKLLKLASFGFLGFSSVPLRVSSFLGFLFSLFGFFGVVYLVFIKLLFGIPLVGWTSTVIIILFIGGIQLLSLGIMGEYISSVFDEVRKRPEYIISQTIGLTRKGEN